jgi:predicted lipid-binding transport protein (Tim44 family)
VPLSEEELRLLEQMERALVAEDPKLASTLRGTTLRATARRRALLAAGMFVVGIVVLMTGAVTKNTVVGIIGFVVMLASAYFALTFWRNQNRAPEQSSRSAHPSFSVIEGGRSKRRSGKTRAPRSRQSMMERFEERWRRRRDQNGY